MVRKITVFVFVNNTSGVQQNHPPSDPVLLLGKAASNWLKLQGLIVLPGCDADESSSDSSDFKRYMKCRTICSAKTTRGSYCGTYLSPRKRRGTSVR